MLLEAGQHSEIALIQYRTAVPLDVAGACALLFSVPLCCAMAVLQRKSDRAPTMRTYLFMEPFCAEIGAAIGGGS
jgi:hypothetical protein